ncbi:hypothetical protein A2164_04200 [Candidatus Curtissbacteria bacterium RBG_13_35_7]|uniref:Uncharacterized protein n=1 Tax=Candidatus Curtissbacteria bacterium RBG_13_35_7 TaxID=1797705 RepID=A0A1F5G579_9BACT|nr:MAG: hypothetical protein A2164_04200 [Candidatus Curtissbacteria bacterium RBG_13_35_7]
MLKASEKLHLEEKIMKKIHKDHVKMRPRFYFVAASILLGIGLAGAVFMALFFINLVFFRLRIHGPLGYLIFGEFGWKPFLATFPWLPFVIAIIGTIGGLILLRRYDISYKKSFLGLVIILAVLILSLGFLVDKAGFNEKAQNLGQLSPFYKHKFMGEEWLVGEIVEVGDNQVTVSTPRNDQVEVSWDEDTLLPFGAKFQIGQRIRVIGEWQDGKFMAKGIGKGGLHWKNGSPIPTPSMHRFNPKGLRR